MKEQLEISLQLEHKKGLVRKLEASGYAFAVWRMPGTTQIRFIVSLREPVQEKKNLSELPKGFVLNLYNDNHPASPLYIPADIELTDDEVKIDPRISDSSIESFLNKLSNTPERIDKHLKSVPRNITETFKSKVQLAVNNIQNARFEKVVLSRFEDIELSDDFNPWTFFEKICDEYPDAFCSISHLLGKGIWIGASPELLIADNNDRFRTIALAGTKLLEGDRELKEIAWKHKEIEEQALVSRYIVNCFKKIRLREFHEHGPKTVKSGSLAHLKTEFEVNYDEVPFDDLADQMLELLHPTSAVCGMPIEKAKPWINEVEEYDREFYAGFLGPVNYDESTDLFVNLRCIKVQNNRARVYAGAGITEESIPYRELEETEMKMQAMKRFL
ncbi:MAG: chorismate-binding protein [Ekhidna sp.]|nr:chorismate-binding protein [Ekhidna sp.]